MNDWEGLGNAPWVAAMRRTCEDHRARRLIPRDRKFRPLLQSIDRVKILLRRPDVLMIQHSLDFEWRFGARRLRRSRMAETMRGHSSLPVPATA